MIRPRSIVLASGNKGKLAELKELLAPFHVEIRSLAEFSGVVPEETGTTFVANALIKARFAAKVAGMPAIADDSGLEVDALNGAPGVFSARYAAPDATDDANNAKLVEALQSVPDAKRSARFRCVLAYVRGADDRYPLVAEGVWEGSILRQSRGSHGFGYDPLFLPLGGERTSAELSRAEKNQMSHRAQSLRALIELLRQHGCLDP